ncbi:lipopolysaccharide core heptose(II) kinase RfaY [Proteinivorax hydrogeniformans]|uniref:Lipopolysaccharide core heptose(II) kinase RfaY n=1 Tax=Proteinivorax hydrogeniformans TaxID=1826727 RepID=A0AAU8HW25_9FIRM
METKTNRQRFQQIVSVFVKHGVKDGVANPRQIRKAFEELGPTFIKVGQILSTRPDILSPEYINEFQKLQDKVQKLDEDQVKQILEKEINIDVYTEFNHFELEPLATASIAQVHTAELKSGEKVVLKIKRPKIEKAMAQDLHILKRLTLFLQILPNLIRTEVIKADEMIEELWEHLLQELDFINEAKNIKKFHENNKEFKFIKTPKVIEQYTTRNLLVLEYIDGIKLSDTKLLEEKGYYLDDIIEKLAYSFAHQVLEDGFFHGDPHPGNIIISNNKIAFIDFGAMGTISRGQRNDFNMLLNSIVTNDIDKMLESILRIGVVKGPIDKTRLSNDLEVIYNSYANQPINEIDVVTAIQDNFDVCLDNNIAVPKNVALLAKAMLTLEGVISEITPEFNAIELIAPYARKQMLKPENIKKETLNQIKGLYKTASAGLKIPQTMLDVLKKLSRNDIKVQMEHTNLERGIREIAKTGNRIVFGLITSSLLMASSIVIVADAGPNLYGVSAIGLVGYLTAGFMGLVLLIFIIRSGKM